MSINNINDILKVNNIAQTSQTAKVKVSENETEKQQDARTDKFVKSPDLKQDETGIYSRESLLEQLRDSEEQRVKAFEDTIRSMAAQQGQEINFTFRGLDLHVTKEQSEIAAKSIEDGGEYSVDNVTDRIMKMAKALAGDDPSKIDTLKNAVIKGFKGAADLLGKNSLDEMPEITSKTYDNVMKQFDDWKASYEKTAEENVNVDNNAAGAYAAVQASKVTA